MREDPTPRPTNDHDDDCCPREGGEAPVRLDFLVRRVMEECRSRLAAEDATRDPEGGSEAPSSPTSGTSPRPPAE